ncbi:MAG: TMEM165/GDT1 family protein [Wenzhouxiangellaceae bacterium]|nr:TMEM165/GDT1 family protein [Wenzhouxiangellaceae bacterium]MBS3746398.1 TMEM165/GDT1 family protein [Wenzhouxiangellaceae bacterium]
MESFFLTFPTVAIAELGDKTQLVVLFLAARFKKPRAVLAGLLLGAAANAAVAVVGGALLDRLLPAGLLEWLVALLFLFIGGWILFGHEHTDETPPPVSSHGAFLTTLWLFFIMEMGDKTQLATVALAAGLPSAAWVFAGAALGLAAANVPALWLGHRFASRLPHGLLHRLSAFLFIAVGLALIVQRLAL